MKLSIHSDVLVEVAEFLLSGQSAPVLELLQHAHQELWSPMPCVMAAHGDVETKHGTAAAKRLLDFVEPLLAIPPLNKNMFFDFLKAPKADALANCHLASCALGGVNTIVTRTLESSQVDGMKCLTPEGVLEHHSTQQPSVPFLDLKAQMHKVFNDIDDRITDIAANTSFILGRHVEEFEREFAKIHGARFCVGVSSGTDALHLAFTSLGIGPGDEVIVPTNTFIATAEGVSLCGATPVFVDVDEFHNIDVEATRATLETRKGSGNVRAIVPVHLYGQPADLDGIAAIAREHNLAVIEDCAQAHLAEYRGSPIGTSGAFGAFSFYPGKNLGAWGEAGAVITNDEELYHRAKMYRAHGESRRYFHSIIGHNYRMAAIQGAVLATKVRHIAEWTAARRRNADMYRQLLAGVEQVQLPAVAEFANSVYHLFVIQVEDRDALRAYLDEHSVSTGLHYPEPLHLQDAYSFLRYRRGDFPVAEQQAKRILSLPMYPELSERQIEHVCSLTKAFFGRS